MRPIQQEHHSKVGTVMCHQWQALSFWHLSGIKVLRLKLLSCTIGWPTFPHQAGIYYSTSSLSISHKMWLFGIEHAHSDGAWTPWTFSSGHILQHPGPCRKATAITGIKWRKQSLFNPILKLNIHCLLGVVFRTIGGCGILSNDLWLWKLREQNISCRTPCNRGSNRFYWEEPLV